MRWRKRKEEKQRMQDVPKTLRTYKSPHVPAEGSLGQAFPLQLHWLGQGHAVVSDHRIKGWRTRIGAQKAES